MRNVGLLLLGLATSAAAAESFRNWQLQLKPNRAFREIFPDLEKEASGPHQVTLGSDGGVFLDGIDAGLWAYKAHPYELLDKLHDQICFESSGLHFRVQCSARIWDRHLPRHLRRRMTSGIVTVQIPQGKKLTVATFHGQEV